MDLPRQEKKRQRREKHVQAPRSYTVKLPNNTFAPVSANWTPDSLTLTSEINKKKLVCTFTFGTTKVDRRVHYYSGWRRYVARDESNKPILVKIPHPSTTADLSIDGQRFSAVAVCKPPDVFDRKAGMKLSLRHVLKTKAIHETLDEEDYEAIVKVCLTKPPRPTQIRRIEKMLKTRKKKSPPTGRAAK